MFLPRMSLTPKGSDRQKMEAAAKQHQAESAASSWCCMCPGAVAEEAYGDATTAAPASDIEKTMTKIDLKNVQVEVTESSTEKKEPEKEPEPPPKPLTPRQFSDRGDPTARALNRQRTGDIRRSSDIRRGSSLGDPDEATTASPATASPEAAPSPAVDISAAAV